MKPEEPQRPSFPVRLLRGVADITRDFLALWEGYGCLLAILLIPLALVILFYTFCKPY